MKYQYDLLKVSLIASLFSLSLFGISHLIVSRGYSNTFGNLLAILRNSATLLSIAAFCIFICVIGYWVIKGFGVKNFFRSLWVTFAIRQFCHFETGKPSISGDGKTMSSYQQINQRANRSLYTLNVIFKNDKAQLSWYLPYNNESKTLLLRLFPSIKTELNQLAKDYVFNDITNVKGNYYQASAYKL